MNVPVKHMQSPSVMRAVQVRDRHDQFITERWNSIKMLLTCPHQCRRLVQIMCYHVYVIMHVKEQASVCPYMVCMC